jgi:DNA-binding MurR/RpiR family transcriptional regulator
MTPFGFAAQLSQAATRHEWIEAARKVEGLGYSTLSMTDHFGDQLATVASGRLAWRSRT